MLQRLQCRDLLDLDLFLDDEDLTDAVELFRRKASHKGLDPVSFADKFEKRVKEYEKRWDQEFGEYLGEVPHFDEVQRKVRRALRQAQLL
ncbi:MAG: hypothetical protein AB7O24_30240 [Kofleriaceae bacterium]